MQIDTFEMTSSQEKILYLVLGWIFSFLAAFLIDDPVVTFGVLALIVSLGCFTRFWSI